jgi:hypothetical protein
MFRFMQFLKIIHKILDLNGGFFYVNSVVGLWRRVDFVDVADISEVSGVCIFRVETCRLMNFSACVSSCFEKQRVKGQTERRMVRLVQVSVANVIFVAFLGPVKGPYAQISRQLTPLAQTSHQSPLYLPPFPFLFETEDCIYTELTNLNTSPWR